jgi:cellulose synthase/poly-beta-1,6-N-acetylglucosamine synthase-like glycosyltransferase
MLRPVIGVSTAVRASLAVISAYLGVLTVAGAAASRRTRPVSAGSRRRYSVLIPAHDEERLIGATVASVARLDYPPESVEVHVVADNCTDSTSAVARSAGACVHEREDPARPGKGPALQWLLARLSARGELGDAVVFIDADTVVDAGFLRAVDAQLDRGALVVQGHYAVADDGSSPAVAFRAAAMAARTYLRPMGRTAIGGSAGLHGNGMIFHRSAVADLRWSDHLTEDVELHVDLLLAGIRVQFAPDARVAAEMPSSLAAARTQHERWERGRVEIARRYVPRLLRRVVKGGSAGRVAYLDAAMDLLVPPLSVVAGAAAGTSLVGAARRCLTGDRGGGDLVVGMTTMAIVTGHVLTALRLTDAPPSTYRALLQTPRMVAWKLRLWFGVVVDPGRATWTRTERNR